MTSEMSSHVFVDDLSPSQIRLVEQRMRPGGCSTKGFLRNDQSLVEVIERDNRTLRSLGVSHEEIVGRLEEILSAHDGEIWQSSLGFEPGTSDLPSPRSPNDGFRIECIQWMGLQECPFIDTAGRECDQKSSRDYVLHNTRNGKTLRFPGLILHLIGDHHFFEGKKPYRVAPSWAIEVLDLGPRCRG
jgi:hypothetical protein